MRKTILTLVAMIIYIATSMAQTLFEVKYYDIDDQQTYKGLFFYTDDDNCFLRCVNKKNQYWERNYYCQYEKMDGANYLYFLPQPSENRNEPVFPTFCMAYSTDGEFETTTWAIFQDVYDEDELLDENMKEVDYFREVNLAEKDKKYFLQFYDEDETMFKTIMRAKQQLSEQDNGNNSNDNNSNNNDYTPDSNAPVTMHLLLVAATKDESIGESVTTDVNLVKKNFSGIAKKLGIAYKETIIAGDDFEKSNIQKAVSRLSVGSNDVVIFVYSGHGFRFDDDTDEHPRMYLTYDGDLNENTEISTTELYNEITAKKARLTIFLTDCCNSKVGVQRAEVESVAFGTRAANNNMDINKLRALFVEESGTIRATAAKPGQYARCDASGGFMLTSILNNIKAQSSALNDNQPSWNTIVENASKAVAKKTSNIIDEAGNTEQPQVVVRSVKVKNSPSSGKTSALADNSIERSNDNNSKSYDEEEDDDWSVLLCLLVPALVIIVLIVVIIKLLNKRKNK